MDRVTNVFTRKLVGLASLNEHEIALLDAEATPIRLIAAHRDLIREGDKPGPVFVVLDGWACRYKMLPDGSRQIVAFMMPGDFCDIHAGILDEMDHAIGTLTACQIVAIPRERMDRLIVATPALTHAFWRAQLVDEGVLRAWIVSIGRRDSLQRVAHLMLELYVRLRSIGLANDERCEMPLTQAVLADSLGLTPVHLNRVLKVLRERRAMTLTGGTLQLLDPRELVRIAGFDNNYLHRRVPDEVG
ncbi:Crp/Fnr family transcriptional regulator [Sphingomonas sp.]|uniref:Crp/Fnr family transcriptional regulator n=1 Tax=Sphingomonas sp. TaxID=28214 RepID=UPI003AFFBB9F